MRLRAAAGVRGRALVAAAVLVAVLAAARVCGGRRGDVRAVPSFRLPLPGASTAAIQYYLVPPYVALAARAARPRSRPPALYKYLLVSGELRTAREWT